MRTPPWPLLLSLGAALCVALTCARAAADEHTLALDPSTLREDVLLAPARGPRLLAEPPAASTGPSLRRRSESARRWLRLGIPLLVGAGAATLAAELPQPPRDDGHLLPVARTMAAANLLLGAAFVGFGAYRVHTLGSERPTPMRPGVRIASVLASLLLAGGAFATVGAPYLAASVVCDDTRRACN